MSLSSSCMRRGQGQHYDASQYISSLERLRSRCTSDMDMLALDLATKSGARMTRGLWAAQSQNRRWAVDAAIKVVEAHTKKLLLPHQYAIGVPSGAEKMGKRTSFDAAQLPNHQWLIPDVFNAYNELDLEDAVNDMCEVHPLAGTMTIALYTVPTVYVLCMYMTLEELSLRNIQQFHALFKVIAQGCMLLPSHSENRSNGFRKPQKQQDAGFQSCQSSKMHPQQQ